MRYLEKDILADLKNKMVFISGPRQCGKTTLIKDLIKSKSSLYLNWDDINHRKLILNRTWTEEHKILAFDEIHKYSRWKNFIKGTYDTQNENHQFVITGSAKLDIYRKGQDSMMGRFFSWRMHPLCLSELTHNFKYKKQNALNQLLIHGGFPEPFLNNNERFSKRWRNERINQIFRQDIKDLAQIKDINILEMFYQLLTERVTSEIALSNIARDLEIAPKTAKAWLQLLENTYALFTVMPYFKNLTKAIVKAPKVYFFDNGEVLGDEGAKFENLVANHLYKKIQYLEDSTGDRYELRYIRDRNGPEIDFIILKNRKPEILIEAKSHDKIRSRHLHYFKNKLKTPKAVQLIIDEIKPSTKDGVLLISATDFLSQKISQSF